VPEDGFPWRPTRQPVVLDAWPVTPAPFGGRVTTVMQWDSYPAREYGGRRYGMKSESFGPYLDLPERCGRVLELALGSASAPAGHARRAGVAPARPPPGDPRPVDVPGLRPGVEGGVRGRQARLRRQPVRVVQRAERLLPCLRPTRARTGRRFHGLALGRGRGG